MNTLRHHASLRLAAFAVALGLLGAAGFIAGRIADIDPPGARDQPAAQHGREHAS